MATSRIKSVNKRTLPKTELTFEKAESLHKTINNSLDKTKGNFKVNF
jgi:hypothetical protein